MPKTATPRKPETVSRKLAETRAKSKNRSLSSLLGIGDNEKRLVTDFGSGLNDVIGRGTIAGLLGLPGDIGGAAENGLRSLLGLPQVIPYGGSEHIGQKLEQAGLVSSVRRPKTELLASLISPAQAATAGYKAPQMARAGVKALDNLSAPRTMGRQQGAIENLWHGSPNEFDAFDLGKAGESQGGKLFGGRGVYLADNPADAKAYGDNLYRVSLDNKKTLDARDAEQFKAAFANAVPKGEEKTLAELIAEYDYAKANTNIEDVLVSEVRPGFNDVQWKIGGEWRDNFPQSTNVSSLELSGDPTGREYAMRSLLPKDPSNYMGRMDAFPEDAVRQAIESGGYDSAIIPGSIGHRGDEYVAYDPSALRILERNGQPVGNLGKMVAPQDEALRVAQANAAKPEGLQGLLSGADNVPMKLKGYHGGARIENGDYRIPAFFGESADDVDWYVNEGGGHLNTADLSFNKPLDITTKEGRAHLYDVARRLGIDIGKEGEFYAPEIAKHSPYEGTNDLDLVYIPQVREALLKDGYDGIKASDTLTNYEIPAWVALTPDVIQK